MEEIISREEVSKIFNSNIKIELDSKYTELIIDYLLTFDNKILTYVFNTKNKRLFFY